jgi:hypothetical protein
VFFPLAELAARFGVDLQNCAPVQGVFFSALYDHAEIAGADFEYDKLRVTPYTGTSA